MDNDMVHPVVLCSLDRWSSVALMPITEALTPPCRLARQGTFEEAATPSAGPAAVCLTLRVVIDNQPTAAGLTFLPN